MAKSADGLQWDQSSDGINLLQETRGGGVRGTGAHQQAGEGGICPSTNQGKKVSQGFFKNRALDVTNVQALEHNNIITVLNVIEHTYMQKK